MDVLEPGDVSIVPIKNTRRLDVSFLPSHVVTLDLVILNILACFYTLHGEYTGKSRMLRISKLLKSLLSILTAKSVNKFPVEMANNGHI